MCRGGERIGEKLKSWNKKARQKKNFVALFFQKRLRATKTLPFSIDAHTEEIGS